MLRSPRRMLQRWHKLARRANRRAHQPKRPRPSISPWSWPMREWTKSRRAASVSILRRSNGNIRIRRLQGRRRKLRPTVRHFRSFVWRRRPSVEPLTTGRRVDRFKTETDMSTSKINLGQSKVGWVIGEPRRLGERPNPKKPILKWLKSWLGELTTNEIYVLDLQSRKATPLKPSGLG
jgi:hypothetical protein